MTIIGRVEAGDQQAAVLDAALELRGYLQGDSPGKIMQAEAGNDDRGAALRKWKRLADVHLEDVRS